MRLPGAIYELLPGGEDGQLSKHPRPGVTQISFGEMEPNKKNLEALYVVAFWLIVCTLFLHIFLGLLALCAHS